MGLDSSSTKEGDVKKRTWLQLEAIHNKSEGHNVTLLLRGVLPVGRETPLSNQVPIDFVQGSVPDLTNVVNFLALIEVRVDVRVDLHVKTVRELANTTSLSFASEDPSANNDISVALVFGDHSEDNSKKVAPAFTHATRLTSGQAVGVCRSSSHTVGNTVTILVLDDIILKITITVGGGECKDVHAHAAVLAVWRAHEVGIVGSGSILGVANNGVVTESTLAKVVRLEVASLFVEPIPILKCGGVR